MNFRRLPALRQPWLYAVLIVLAGMAAYRNGLSGPFVFDTPTSVATNPTIRRLWPPWAALSPPREGGLTVSGRPLLNFSLAVNYAFGGTDVWGYHALNLAIHLLAGLTLFGIVRRTLRRDESLAASATGADGAPSAEMARRSRVPKGWLCRAPFRATEAQAARLSSNTPELLAFAIALLWTVHPLQTEAVTYVIQRAESLMGLFYLLTVYCFIRSVEADGETKAWRLPLRVGSGSRQAFAGWAILSVLACLFGMATKEVMVSAPVIVLIYDRTFVAGSFGEAWRRRRCYYAALASTWILLAFLVASTGGNRSGSVGFGVGVTWWQYGLTQFDAIVRYLRLSFWPAPLVFEYGVFWTSPAATIAPKILIVSALIAITIVGLCRRSPVGLLGAFFFSVLAPTSLVPGTTQMIVEHRMYLPLAAVITATVCGAYAALVWASAGRLNGKRTLTVAGGAGVVAAALLLGRLTARRNEDYRSDVAIWTDTVAKRPDNPLAQHMLADALERTGDLSGAVAHYERALRLKTNFSLSHANLAAVLFRLGRLPEAIDHYEIAVRLQPRIPFLQVSAAGAFVRAGRPAEAISHYRAALALTPEDADVHYALANELAEVGQRAEAVSHYEAALRLKPDFPEAEFNLANTLADLRQTAEAANHYAAAVRLRPAYPAAEYNWANTLAAAGDLAPAVVHYEAALRLRPDYPEAENNLGSALSGLGRWAEAAAHYRSALRLQPDSAEARTNLARAEAQLQGSGLGR